MRSFRPLTVVLAVALVATACTGSDDARPTDGDTELPATSAVLDADPSVATSAPSPPPATIPDGPLAQVCPATIVVQTTGQPGVQVGSLFQLLGPDSTIGGGGVSGPLVRPDGTVDDVTLEIRSGGPATGFEDAVTVASTDDSVTIVHTSLSAMVERFADSPTIAVAALTDRSRQAIVVDPVTYPEVSGVDDVAAAGIEIRHFTDSPSFRYLEFTGALSADQLVAGFGGEPASFVAADGTIAQQGDLLVDPALFASIPQWDRPVLALPLADAGWADHDDVLAVRSADLDGHSECLARFVPIVQAAIVAYAADPAATNALLAQVRADSDPLSRVTAESLDIGQADSIALGVVGNGDDGTIGDVDVDRLAAFLPDLADALGVDDVGLDELTTQDFVDASVGL